jgi:hypothetical protein
MLFGLKFYPDTFLNVEVCVGVAMFTVCIAKNSSPLFWEIYPYSNSVTFSPE